MRADDTTMSALMGKAQKGDAEAYRAVLDHSRKWLTGFYRGRIDPAAADDLVQETLMSVLIEVSPAWLTELTTRF